MKTIATIAGAAALALASVSPARAQAPSVKPPGAGPPIAIAVMDFDYRDSSGEPRDQTREHAERLAAFASALRADLAASGAFKVVSVTCASPPCTAATIPPAKLLADARASGAQWLLYGEIFKTSTLIQWQRVQVVDLVADRLLDGKLLSFRGDTDEAWRRAEVFLAREIVELGTK